MFSRKPSVHEVECPHCHSRQTESIAAISTNCRACGRYFKLQTKVERAEARGPRTPKEMREVVCITCGAMNLVPSAALSTQCTRCSHYLELGNKVIKGVHTGKIHVYDDVLFAEGCSFKGMEAVARNIEVRGKVFSKLRATAEIVAMAGASISGELHAPVVRIEHGADARVQVLECDRLLVSGAVEISGRLAAGEIVLNDGATFSGRLNVPQTKLRISHGATVRFDSIHCAGLVVEGDVTLGTRLEAETVFVMNGGSLHAPAIRAARIEVSPGSFLQARIEKYSPPELDLAEAPAPEPAPDVQPEPKVEAA
jgi:cytoskeletal protein CcmA (bactofilin family)/DNA-directed RNA polymerase subunit RPC12/RpoP